MEKRVVIFLVLSLAVILGYDLLLKQLGLLPPPKQCRSRRPRRPVRRLADPMFLQPRP